MDDYLELLFHGGPLDGRTQRCFGGTAVIGRDPQNDISLPSPGLSRRHGRLAVEDGVWKYQDLNSFNGTLVRRADGTEVWLTGPVRAAIPLREGDRLVLGDSEIEIHIRPADDPANVRSFTMEIVHRVGLRDLEADGDATDDASARMLRVLHRFVKRLGQAASHNEVLQELLRFVLKLNDHAERALLIEVADGQALATMGFDRAGRDLAPDGLEFSRGVVEETLHRQDGLLILDAPENFPSHSLVKLQVRSLMSAPLWDADAVRAIVLVEGGSTANVFRPADLRLMMFFVYHASLVMGQLRLIGELHSAFQSSVKALVRSLDMRDPNTSAHSLKVQTLALQIAKQMRLPPDREEVLRYAAMLHDIGKIAIPDEILLGKGALDERQRETMSRHAQYTREVLDLIDFPRRLRDVPLAASAHHERLDGRGPLGLKGEQIPLEARIIAVADVFEALTATRTYKSSNRTAETLALLRKMAGAALDPAVIAALEKAILF
jgi:putative nucleotidyltransferase with HDIG domain